MKKWFVFFIATAFMACNSENKTDHSEVVEDSPKVVETSPEGSFGAALTELEISDMSVLQTSLDTDSEFTGKIEVEIEDVCQMKGCWMTAKLPDGRSMRITFKDYGFFVPKDAAGFKAVIEGKAIKKMTDEATLKHYAEESGKSKEEIDKIDGPGEELNFIAEGVEIKS